MPKPDVIVIGPGGIKGFLELGALFTLEQSGYMSNVKIICGVSVGSIISLLSICGYTAKEIAKESIDIHIFEMNTFAEVKENGGLFKTRNLEDKLSKLVQDKLKINHTPTFYELYLLTGKLLCVVGTNRTDNQAIYFTPEETPNQNVVNAVMGSINIPVCFGTVEINSKIIDDGAISNPYPVDYFDDGKNVIFGMFVENLDMGDSIISTIHKSITSIMRYHRNRIISMASENVYHIELLSDCIDVIGITTETNKKAQMIIKGTEMCRAFLDKISKNEKIDLKSYFKPKKREDLIKKIEL